MTEFARNKNIVAMALLDNEEARDALNKLLDIVFAQGRAAGRREQAQTMTVYPIKAAVA